MRSRPGPVDENLHNLSSGVEPRPFSRPIAATIFTIAKTGATLTLGQERAKEKTALTAEPRRYDFT
jgi:hypothetical protein